MKVKIVTQQKLIEYCDAELEVPDEVASQGALEIAEYVRQNAHVAERTDVRCLTFDEEIELFRFKPHDEK
jgi:hypothetical protein